MSAKHTSGPWTTEDRGERILIWAEAENDFIAQLLTESDADDDEARTPAEHEANARLIAAAPDLAAACEALLAAHPLAPAQTYFAARDLALAALAKAGR